MEHCKRGVYLWWVKGSGMLRPLTISFKDNKAFSEDNKLHRRWKAFNREQIEKMRITVLRVPEQFHTLSILLSNLLSTLLM